MYAEMEITITMKEENKTSDDFTTGNGTSDKSADNQNVNQYNNIFLLNNIIKYQQNYEYMIAHFELHKKDTNTKNMPTDDFVSSHISSIKKKIILFYNKKENKKFLYWILLILSFALSIPFFMFEFSSLLDVIFSL